jgi:hypothetical protein
MRPCVETEYSPVPLQFTTLIFSFTGLPFPASAPTHQNSLPPLPLSLLHISTVLSPGPFSVLDVYPIVKFQNVDKFVGAWYLSLSIAQGLYRLRRRARFMGKNPGGNGSEGLSGSAGGFGGEQELPVIELVDVVDEDSEGGGRPRETSDTAGSEWREGVIDGYSGSEREDTFAGEYPGSSAAETPPKLPYEDFSGLIDISDEEFTFTGDVEDIDSPAFEGSVSLDEKRLEAMITRVVEDVVARVTRETVAQVTEKVLTAAIEALRENPEHPPK